MKNEHLWKNEKEEREKIAQRLGLGRYDRKAQYIPHFR